VLFPWREASQELSKEIKLVLEKTTSSPLRPIRLLFLEFDSGVLERVNSEIARGDWPVHSYQWKHWLSIFLCRLRSERKMSPLTRYPQVLRYLVWLCKEVVKEEFSLFWEVYFQKRRPQESAR
jgi:hypothetical protein